MPHLDDYVMNAHDPFVEVFVWSVDDSRHTESTSNELTGTDVPKQLLFADKDVIQAMRTSSASAAAKVAGRDVSRDAAHSAHEIKAIQTGSAEGRVKLI